MKKLKKKELMGGVANKVLNEVLQYYLEAKTTKVSESASGEDGETFLERNARESNAIAEDNIQAAFHEAERDRCLEEMSKQLKKVLRSLQNYEKRIEKVEGKVLSFQDKMLKQKEWSFDVGNNIKTLNEKVQKQGKDISLIKEIFIKANLANGDQQSTKFKKVAKRMIKFYKRKARQRHKDNIGSCKDVLQI